MAEKLAIFDSETPVEDIEDVQAEVQEAVEEAPAEPEVEAGNEGEGDTEAAPPAAAEEKQQHPVPVTALLDEREKRQNAEREAREASARIQQMEREMAQLRKAQQKPVQRPDIFEKPEERFALERQEVQAQIQDQYLNTCEMFVRDKFGDEKCDEAANAFKQAVQNQPGLYETIMSARNPWAELIKWHDQHTALTEIGDGGLEGLKARLRQEWEAEQAQAPQSTRPKLPGSLASAPSAGGQEPSAVNAPAPLRALFQS